MDTQRLNNGGVTTSIDSGHKDFIHDMAVNFYGDRMATSSSDQTIKVWDKDDNGAWECTATWKAHNASVWKVTWAHPEYGQVLATCSFDRTAIVWEESVKDNSATGQSDHIWVQKAKLVDSRTCVKDVKFAPRHIGLLLAACSENGVVRIYEAPDVMNLTQWTMQHQLKCKIACSSLSWNPSLYRYHSPMIAVGSDEIKTSEGGKVFIFEYVETLREWTKVYTIAGVTDPVNCVNFAPNCGKSFHTLAVASKDVRIFKIKSIPNGSNAQDKPSCLETKEIASFNQHNCKVLNVNWNDLGTVLISSGDDGRILMWMENYLGIWKQVSEFDRGNTTSPRFEPVTTSNLNEDSSQYINRYGMNQNYSVNSPVKIRR